MFDKDQRDWKRVAVNMQARCRVVDGPARYDNVLIVDMHQHGCCLQGHFKLEKGQIVRIVLDLPFEGQINMTGEVRWTGLLNEESDFRAGVHFQINDPAAEETCLKLYHYCLLRQPKV